MLKINRNEQVISDVLRKINISGYKQHTVEQFLFRIYCCKNCFSEKKCKFCKCNPLDKILEPISCNKKVFPDTMNSLKWEEYKKQHNLIIS